MNINVNVYLHGAPVDDPHNIIRLLLNIRKELMATLEELKAAVAENLSVGQSVVVLIDGMVARIQELVDSQATPADFQALVDELTAETTLLANKVTENTPVVEPPIEEPPIV